MEILHTIWTVYSILCVIFTTVFLWNLARNIRREIDLVKDTDTVKKTMKLVYIEQVDDMFRMHDKFTHQYICQASTEKELWDLADAKFPNVKIMSTSISTEVNKL
jgi:Na+-transporting NADH:ubiquinone oxidoreductase subunit NqrB